MTRSASTRPEPLPPTAFADCDRAVAELQSAKTTWVRTAIPDRIGLLKGCQRGLEAELETWATTVCALKGAPRGSAAEGLEWMAGFMPIMRNLRLLIEALEQGGQPRPLSSWQRDDGQWVVRTFPRNAQDRILYTGWSADTWIEPGKPPSQGCYYRKKEAGSEAAGRVALVMAAGNQISIGPMDLLYKLFVEDQVVCLKMNPVNDVDGPHLERAFACLVEAGFLRIVYGGGGVGAYLSRHSGIDSIHLTGSVDTYEAIVWGADAATRQTQRLRGERHNSRPFTAELGCVSPYLVVPARYQPEQLDYHAKQFASAATQNGGHNCAAPQVLVLAERWPQRKAFVTRIKHWLSRTPRYHRYYKGSRERWQSFVDHYPQAEQLGAGDESALPWMLIEGLSQDPEEYAYRNEGFCGISVVVDVDGADADEYLECAVDFANRSLWGTLSCSMVVHPSTARSQASAVDRAVSELRYGTIGINLWAAVGFALTNAPWGSFPGNQPEDTQSGTGVVHNVTLLDHPQKTVLRAPFMLRPKPPWFFDHGALSGLGRGITRFERAPSWWRLIGLIRTALRG
jgi:acyl-CoA reductase-like NAD-dependent aldehyde dehydrogenase